MISSLSSTLLRITAFLTLFVFSVDSLAMGQVPLILRTLGNGNIVGGKTQNFHGVSIPKELGKVLSIKPGIFPASTQHPSIIHIQDAHSDSIAQNNTAQILHYLKKEYGIDLVFVEGAHGLLDAQYLKFTEDTETNQKIAKKLAHLGEFTAADIFLSKKWESDEIRRARRSCPLSRRD